MPLRSHRQRVPAMLAMACIGMLCYAVAGASPNDGRQLAPAAAAPDKSAGGSSTPTTDKGGSGSNPGKGNCDPSTTSTTAKGGQGSTTTTGKGDGSTTSTTDKGGSTSTTGKNGGGSSTPTTAKGDGSGSASAAGANQASTAAADNQGVAVPVADKSAGPAGKGSSDKGATGSAASADNGNGTGTGCDGSSPPSTGKGDHGSTTTTTGKGGKDTTTTTTRKGGGGGKGGKNGGSTTPTTDKGGRSTTTTTAKGGNVTPDTQSGSGGGASGDPGDRPITPQEAPPNDSAVTDPGPGPAADPEAAADPGPADDQGSFDMAPGGADGFAGSDDPVEPLAVPGSGQSVLPMFGGLFPGSDARAAKAPAASHSTGRVQELAAPPLVSYGSIASSPGVTESAAVSRALAGLQSSVTESAFPATVISTPKVFPVNRWDPLAASLLVVLAGLGREGLKAWRRRASRYWPA